MFVKPKTGEVLMGTLVNDLDRWTSDELIAEVLKRGAVDRPALQHLQTAVIRALLAEGDRKATTSPQCR